MSEKLLPQNRPPNVCPYHLASGGAARRGVVMALPWLESVRVLGAPAPFPKRFGVMFMDAGSMKIIGASGDGADDSARHCPRWSR